ncbi:hypothetical protein C8J56DRAFT_1056530 [Mycena floridula]|nr:hypothetical protein C8J56DRAFT_1056530 [Mycena floridula]
MTTGKPYSPWVIRLFSLTIPPSEALEFNAKACQSHHFSDVSSAMTAEPVGLQPLLPRLWLTIPQSFGDLSPGPDAITFWVNSVSAIHSVFGCSALSPFPAGEFVRSEEITAILQAWHRSSSAKSLKDSSLCRPSYKDLFVVQNVVLWIVDAEDICEGTAEAGLVTETLIDVEAILMSVRRCPSGSRSTFIENLRFPKPDPSSGPNFNMLDAFEPLRMSDSQTLRSSNQCRHYSQRVRSTRWPRQMGDLLLLNPKPSRRYPFNHSIKQDRPLFRHFPILHLA